MRPAKEKKSVREKMVGKREKRKKSSSVLPKADSLSHFCP